MPRHDDPHTSGRHLLGPHVVGQRVVIRRLVPGERGPTGGPAFTDVLGVCESWADGVCVVRREDGAPVEIAIADIVSGKPVPPRPSVRMRVSPRDAQLHSLAMWPDVPTRPLGNWVLRSGAAPQEVARTGSVLAMGDPGIPYAEAAAGAEAFYADLSRPAWAQVVVDSPEEQALRSLGWVSARPDEDDSLFQATAVSRLHRALGAPDDGTDLTEDGPRAVASHGALAHGRACVDGDWLGLHDIWVDDAARRRGLARRVLAELVDWGASRGATTAYLQVRADNVAALALYDRLAFATHHRYRYLTAPR